MPFPPKRVRHLCRFVVGVAVVLLATVAYSNVELPLPQCLLVAAGCPIAEEAPKSPWKPNAVTGRGTQSISGLSAGASDTNMSDVDEDLAEAGTYCGKKYIEGTLTQPLNASPASPRRC